MFPGGLRFRWVDWGARYSAAGRVAARTRWTVRRGRYRIGRRQGGSFLSDRSHAPAWERGRDAPASSEWRGMGPGLWEVSRSVRENWKRPTVLNETGRRSVRGGVPTLERGNDQQGSARSAWGDDRRAKWCARRTLRWGGRGVQGAAGWGRAGAGCWANRNGPAAEAAGPGGTLRSGGVIRLGFCGDGPRRPDRPDRCRRAAWWRVRGRAEYLY